MGRPREAIDAAMLAAAIGIDRAVEADIWRFVPGYDLPRRNFLDMGRQRLEIAKRLPAVVGRLIGYRLEAARAVGPGAPPVPAAGGNPADLGREAFGSNLLA